MIMSKRIPTIGLFGLGCVGLQFYQRCQLLDVHVKTICVKRADRIRPGVNAHITSDPDEILNDPEIDLVVELIDDPNVAFELATFCLRKQKPVVTANKRMLAENLEALIDLQKWYDTPIYYEAAVAASIPIIETLKSHYEADDIQEISGVLNGSCNFILSQVGKGLTYDVALQDAREKGFAESDPSLDVDGHDTKFKTTLLAYNGLGEILEPNQVVTRGISAVVPEDLEQARESGKNLKLLGVARRAGDHVCAWSLAHIGEWKVLRNRQRVQRCGD